MTMTMIDFVNKVVKPLKARIMATVGRAVLQTVDDSTKIQLVKIGLMAGEIRDKVERFQNFGFTSVPLVGAECAVVFVAGNREHGIVVAIDDRSTRLTGLKPGESAMYNSKKNKVHLKETEELEIEIKKLNIKNANNELISVLSEWMEKSIAAKNITGIGPQPMDPQSITNLNAVKTKLDTFKV